VACFGPMVVSVWRLVKHIISLYSVLRRCCLAYAWCHREFPVIRNSTHPSLHTISGELHLSFYGITHIAELHKKQNSLI